MIKRALLIFLLIGLTALAGCHTGARTSVRADYYGSYPYGGRYIPYYYDPFYDPFFYGPSPHFFFQTEFLFVRPGRFVFVRDPFFPNRIIILEDRRFVRPGERSLRGFRSGRIGSGRLAPAPAPGPDRSLR